MVGLSVLLESQQQNMNYNHHNSPQVVNKASLIKPSPPPSPSFPSSSSSSFSATRYASSLPTSSFLDECFLCKHRLLPGKDIFMYNGDRAFCSKECRCRQIVMDEENVGMSTRKSKPSSSSSSSSARQSKKNKSKAGGYAFQD